jgi:hypothetical protein
VAKSAAAKMRAYRSRLRAGKLLIGVAVDEVALSALLVGAGFIHPGVDHGRDELSRATEKFLETLMKENEK